MANTNSPYGFRYAGRIDGSAPNVGLATRAIANTNSTPIYFGDPVSNDGSNPGCVARATAGTAQIAGVFYGCSWQSISQNRIQHSPWWPGTGDAVAGSVQCLICDDPLALFLVQCTSGPFAITDVSNNVQFTIGTGNQATGFSGATANAPATNTATLPFRVYSLYTFPVGTGGDTTTAYNWAYVTFNNQDFRVTTGTH